MSYVRGMYLVLKAAQKNNKTPSENLGQELHEIPQARSGALREKYKQDEMKTEAATETKQISKKERFIIIARSHATEFVQRIPTEKTEVNTQFAVNVFNRNVVEIVNNYQEMLNQIFCDKKTQNALGHEFIQKMYEDLTKFLDQTSYPDCAKNNYAKLQSIIQDLNLEIVTWGQTSRLAR